ncbi:hypothetical protein [Aquisalinus flavus]|uniref:Lipoprotein n=1 Tax=Aquisalinus flavus TaxID=1526572 RepID=A0A8J2V351_9PROT|nr:hypothetical protein [Aquisalinus flavus]MBD0426363.1 hypothetical protein [Aquisalinus flavus]UNE48072.1 hypothetical protein FF099_08445 [Aquisalinus flavus]GGD08580.1 hypothetical protein GCM10011342_16740 [Aquisalinus flavus]
MKRFLPFILLALAACGGGEEPSYSPDSAEEYPVEDIPADVPPNEGDAVPDPEADPGGNPASGGVRPADGVYPFQGLWASDFTDCSLEPGTSMDAPVLIEGRTITGLENSCYMFELSAIDDEMSRYEAGLRCTGEGDPYEEVVEIAVEGDTLTKTSAQGTVTWTRCAMGQPGE